jgi:hypothetical protein
MVEFAAAERKDKIWVAQLSGEGAVAFRKDASSGVLLQQFLLMSVLARTLCSCGSGGSGGGNSAGQSRPAPTTFAEAFSQAEASSLIPSLNHDGTLLGVDSDGNGVRDDIDKYIASLPDTPPQKAALIRKAKAIQSTLTVNANDAAAVRALATEISIGNFCLREAYGTVSHEKRQLIEAITIDTRLRFDQYDIFNVAMSGKTMKIHNSGVSCAQ